MRDILLKTKFVILGSFQGLGILGATLMVVNCGSAPAVPSDLRIEAERWVKEDLKSPVPLKFGQTWKFAGLPQGKIVCGEVSGLPGGTEIPVRFTYHGDQQSGGVDPAPRFLALDAPGAALLSQSIMLFERGWAMGCEGSRPSSWYL